MQRRSILYARYSWRKTRGPGNQRWGQNPVYEEVKSAANTLTPICEPSNHVLPASYWAKAEDDERLPTVSQIVDRNHFGDTGGTIAPLQLYGYSVCYPEFTGRYVLGVGDSNSASQT